MRKKPLSSKQLKQMLFSNDNETFYTMQRTLVIQEIIIEKCYKYTTRTTTFWILAETFIHNIYILQHLKPVHRLKMENLMSWCTNKTTMDTTDLVTTSLRTGFQVYLSQPLVLCTWTNTVRYDLLGVKSDFWVLYLFLVYCLGGWNQ